jgi:hypothetical protein
VRKCRFRTRATEGEEATDERAVPKVTSCSQRNDVAPWRSPHATDEISVDQ